ncbi:MAG: DUF3540 domain-containing protein [Planctomycetota bacterium]
MTFESMVEAVPFQRGTVIGRNDRAEVRIGLDDGSTVFAQVLNGRSYEVGDRVLVVQDAEGAIVLGALGGSVRPEVRVGGVAAQCETDTDGNTTLRVTDAEGRQLLSHDEASGVTTLSIHGDERLRITSGRSLELFGAEGVRIVSGSSVGIDAASAARLRTGDSKLTLTSQGIAAEGRATLVRTPSLFVEAEAAGLSAERMRVVGSDADVRLENTSARFGTLRMRAAQVFRTVSGLCQTLAERVRTVTKGAYQVDSGRTRMVSKGDTSIDGEHIHLG